MHGWPKGATPLLQELDIADTDAGREAYGLWFFDGCSHLLCPAPGITEAVRVLSQRYALGVITNGNDAIQRRKFGYLGLEDYFSVFVSSERAGCFKPEPAIFELALAEAGVAAGEAVFVGDTPSVDIAGARAAGMRPVWLSQAGAFLGPGDPLPDATIRHFGELPGVLLNLD